MEQEKVTMDFISSDSWVILSPIEQRIKNKIEAVGTPLKDWDIQINYGIKTGCNEAFIITTEKREAILANCKTEDERKRTAELIRPILRGRDIRRYGYLDNGLFLIDTHNGVKDKLPPIDINNYPAVKAHLEQFWDKISVRSDRGDTPYNLRSCAYWEDVNKPKIVYQELTQGSSFCLDEKAEYVVANTGYLLTGGHLKYMLALLNSKLIEFSFRRFYSISLGSEGLRWLAQYVENLPIVKPTEESENRIITLLDEKNLEEIEKFIYTLYGLTEDEIALISSSVN